MNTLEEVEDRTPPNEPSLHEAATQQPGQWVYDIDYAYRPEQRVPPEAIRGAWESGQDGELTGKYSRNTRYRGIEHQKSDLKPYMHAGAKTNRDQWIVDIDPRGESLFPSVPENLIRGWWYVDRQGNITDLFRPNSKWIDDPVSTASVIE